MITIIYKGWISVAAPHWGKDATVILSPNRFFYRNKNHILAEKISGDLKRCGRYVSVRMWAHHARIDPSSKFLRYSSTGYMVAGYKEIYDSSSYRHTVDAVCLGNFDLLEEIASYYHHYAVIEITYHTTEFDMVSHEMERIILSNQSL